MGQNFFDTNVIIYLTDQRDSNRLVSRGLIKAGGVVSVQVLNETTRVLRGRNFNLSWEHVDDVLNGIKATCDVVPLTLATHERARSYAERYQLGIFDANIIAAAVLASCDTLYSEDMHDGLVIDGLTIRNPFAKG
jgi:predicted nucleic acid-binding protein